MYIICIICAVATLAVDYLNYRLWLSQLRLLLPHHFQQWPCGNLFFRCFLILWWRRNSFDRDFDRLIGHIYLEFNILSICSVTAGLPFLLYELTDPTLAILALLNLDMKVAIFRVIPVICGTGLPYEQILIVDNYIGWDWFAEETRLTVAHWLVIPRRRVYFVPCIQRWRLNHQRIITLIIELRLLSLQGFRKVTSWVRLTHICLVILRSIQLHKV